MSLLVWTVINILVVQKYVDKLGLYFNRIIDNALAVLIMII